MALPNILNRSRYKSPWLLYFNGGGCNGCAIEIAACLTPIYDLERFGTINTGNPKHADLLIVAGTVNHRNRRTLENLYRAMPPPRIVLAIGACACTGGIFKDAYNVLGGADRALPVDVYLPGCPPKPEAIIDGILKGIDLFETSGGKHVSVQG